MILLSIVQISVLSRAQENIRPINVELLCSDYLRLSKHSVGTIKANSKLIEQCEQITHTSNEKVKMMSILKNYFKNNPVISFNWGKNYSIKTSSLELSAIQCKINSAGSYCIVEIKQNLKCELELEKLEFSFSELRDKIVEVAASEGGCLKY